MKPSLPTRRLRSRPGCAAASMAGGTGWRVPARRAGRPGLVSSRMKGSWSRVAEGCASPCSQPPLTWRRPAIDPWPPSRGPPAGLALTSRGPGSDLALAGSVPVPAVSRERPARAGSNPPLACCFAVRSMRGQRQVHARYSGRGMRTRASP